MKTLDFVEPFTKKRSTSEMVGLSRYLQQRNGCPHKTHQLSHASLFPTNFEKQKVSLAVNVFNEKNVAELTDKEKLMVENVNKIWHILMSKQKLEISQKSMDSQYTDRA